MHPTRQKAYSLRNGSIPILVSRLPTRHHGLVNTSSGQQSGALAMPLGTVILSALVYQWRRIVLDIIPLYRGGYLVLSDSVVYLFCGP